MALRFFRDLYIALHITLHIKQFDLKSVFSFVQDQLMHEEDKLNKEKRLLIQMRQSIMESRIPEY